MTEPTDEPTTGTDPSFLQSENVWVLIPLAALTIPIIAVSSESVLIWVVGAIALIAAIALAVRSVLEQRTRLRIRELQAKERLAIAERERYSAIDRIVGEVDAPHLTTPPESRRDV